jgi:phage virion morphogenesis protein
VSSIEMDIAIVGDLKAGLTRLLAAGGDLTPAMKEIATHLETAGRLRFEQERDPQGKPWKPSRRVLEEGGQTLTLSGDLKSSIGSRWGADYAEAGPERSFGAAVYAAIHQFGGVIRPKAKKALSFGGRVVASVTIPARAYLGFAPSDPETFAGILRDHFRTSLQGENRS